MNDLPSIDRKIQFGKRVNNQTMGAGDDVTNEWDRDAYRSNHSFVYEYGTDVLELLTPHEDERILDLGCGTGELTKRIATDAEEVVGLDNSAEMIETAQAEVPECSFVQEDARTVRFDEAFDAVFSNAMLHWVPDDGQDRVLENIREALVPGGRFVAEMGGLGNVSAITDAVERELDRRGYDRSHPWYFPSVGTYTSRLEVAGFEVRYARLFDRPTELEGGQNGLASWLEMFGDGLFAPLSADEQASVVATVEDELRDDLFEDDNWIADYRRLRFVAVRE